MYCLRRHIDSNADYEIKVNRLDGIADCDIGRIFAIPTFSMVLKNQYISGFVDFCTECGIMGAVCTSTQYLVCIGCGYVCFRTVCAADCPSVGFQKVVSSSDRPESELCE